MRATPTTASAGHCASHASTRPSGSHTAAATRAAAPSTVAGPTKNSASRFAGSDSRVIVAVSETRIGRQNVSAAAVQASDSATRCGSPRRRSRSCHPGARMNKPAVADRDSKNP